MKDIIVNNLIGDLIKKQNVKREDIESIKRLYTIDKPFSLRAFDYSKPQVIKKMKFFLKPRKIEDYENLIPPSPVIRKF